VGTFTIKYCFNFKDEPDKEVMPEKEIYNYDVEVDSDSLFVETKQTEGPEWTKLDNCKCTNCPFDSKEVPYCPIALQLNDLVESFDDCKSYIKTTVMVQDDHRVYYKKTDLQSGLISLFGLLMASSRCPHMKVFRPLVRFHLPFASTEETLFRVVSSRLLSNYFQNDWLSFDKILEQLNACYKNVYQVNKGILNRINSVVSADANKNAFVGLSLFAQIFSMEFEEKLDGLSYLFKDQKY
jgi:hypothetical protein